jgi:Zn-dependent peptidase ImmA (M78 family)
MSISRGQIRSAARSLLSKSRAHALPVDLEAVAKHLAIRILYEDMANDMSGLLVVKAGKRAIGVNRNHYRNRQRFTIAHEIGHFVLHHKSFEDPKNDLHWDKKWAYFRSAESAGADLDEYEANQFAAELLMPEDLLRDLIKRERIDLSDDIDISRLADALQVSEQALTIRLIALKMVEPY